MKKNFCKYTALFSLLIYVIGYLSIHNFHSCQQCQTVHPQKQYTKKKFSCNTCLHASFSLNNDRSFKYHIYQLKTKHQNFPLKFQQEKLNFCIACWYLESLIHSIFFRNTPKKFLLNIRSYVSQETKIYYTSIFPNFTPRAPPLYQI